MAETQIDIPSIVIERALITIVGETPLITHRFGDLALAAIADKQQKKAKVAKAARNPKAEFLDALYVIDQKDKKYGFPGGGIKKALVNAGGRFADEKMTVLRGLVNVKADLVEIMGSEPRMREDPVRLSGGVMSIAYRPEFFPWSMQIPITFNAGMISKSQVINLLDIAGFAVGIGDWRPEKNGIFGTFRVVEG